jgi:hypothetical protein
MIITLIGRFQPPLFIVTVSTKWIRPDPQQQQATSRVVIFIAIYKRKLPMHGYGVKISHIMICFATEDYFVYSFQTFHHI